jgi:hypothetical protein
VLTCKQNSQSRRISQAAGTTDEKTAFWSAYMKLADEHDKQFQQKCSTDLDTALIFVLRG